jgi:NitT/TauT family transport system substrate-binding protein
VTGGRRALAGAAALAAGFLGPAARSQAADAPLPDLHLVLSWYAKPDFGGYYAAEELGFWKALGLRVTILPGGPNAQVEKRVLTEPFTVGTASADQVIMDVAHGLPLVAINTFLQRDGQIILLHDESPVHRMEDLQGRSLFATTGSNFLSYIVWKYHLDRLQVQPHPGSVAAFLTNPEAMSHAVLQNEPVYAEQAGVKVRWLSLRDAGFDSFQVIVATHELVDRHPEVLRRFSLGAYLGWAAFLRDPEPVFARIVKDNPDINVPGMRQAFANIKQYHLIEGSGPPHEGLGAVSPERWAALRDDLQACGLLTDPVTLADAYTDQFTPDKVGYPPRPAPH